MFGGRGAGYGQPSSNGQRSHESPTPQRPFQRYEISPVRDTGLRSGSPIKLHANFVDGYEKPRTNGSSRDDWRGRSSNSPRARRLSISPIRRRTRSPERRRSRSRSFERNFQRRGNFSPRGRVMSRSPIRTRLSRSHSRSPQQTWRHQEQRFSPQPRRFRSPSPCPVDLPQRDSYAYNRRSRSRSNSNMEVASTGSSPNDLLFRSTFRPIEPKKTKKIKITVPKDLPRDESSSPEVVEYRGYKIRNAPDVQSNDSKRKSRWDADQSALPVPNTKELLKQQGIANPDEALQKIADLPTMESRFKAQTNDDHAVQEQLRLLEQQSRFEKLRENLPPSVGLPARLAFSAIAKAPKPVIATTTAPITPAMPNPALITSKPSSLPPVANFPPQGFPPFGAPLPGSNVLPPQMGLPPSFGGPTPAGFQMPQFAMPQPVFNPGNGMMSQVSLAQGFNALPPMPNYPQVSAAFTMPMMSAAPPTMSGPDVVKFDLTNIGPPPVPMEQQIDPTEMLFRARADLYRRDLSEIRAIPDLMKYMWGQGFDPIPADDPQLLFNEVLKEREGTLGASALYQIICFGHPELETYYCGMCNHWTTVSEMFGHLNASMHRMSFLSRNYKLFHKRAEEHQDLDKRDKFLDFICKKVWKIDGSGRCVNRMRCILNIDAIKQVWPNYMEFVDNSWKMMGSKDSLDAMLNNGRTQLSQLDEMPVMQQDNQFDAQFPGGSNKGKITIKPSLNSVLSRPIGELEKVSERERRSSRERRRSRSKSRERTRKRSRSRRRSKSRSPSRRESRRRSKSPRRLTKDDSREWERKAAHFIEKINGDGIKSALNQVSSGSSRNDDSESSRARLLRKETVESEQELLRITRKAVAVLIELQQMHNKSNSIKKSMIYTIASEMGMDEEMVQQSKILKQGLETMNIVDDTIDQKSVSLESMGLSSSDLKKLLNSVSSVSKSNNDVSMVYPEVGDESRLVVSIRAAIREIQQKMSDPKNSHMISELQRRLDHLEIKLSQELGVDPIKRLPVNAAVRSRQAPAANQSLLPGAWRDRTQASRDNAAATMRARQEQNDSATSSRTPDKTRFDASKVEREWTEYFIKDPAKIDDFNRAGNEAEAAQYDGYYGPGTYSAFIAAKKQAALNAKKQLASSRQQSKSYFEDFSA